MEEGIVFGRYGRELNNDYISIRNRVGQGWWRGWGMAGRKGGWVIVYKVTYIKMNQCKAQCVGAAWLTG